MHPLSSVPSVGQLKDSATGYANSLLAITAADFLRKRADSIQTVKLKWEADKQTYDSLNRQLGQLEKEYHSLSDKASGFDKSLVNNIKLARNNQQLSSAIEDSGIPDSLLPAGYKNLLAIKSFGIGRTVVDYSELSAKNITINGIEAEYNPHNYYYAVAAGMIDYRYRDLIFNNPDRQKQYLTVGRIGKGRLDGNNLILTWYQGKKQLYNYVTSNNDSVRYPDFHLTGFTLEGHYKVGTTTLLTAEVAKSASPFYNRSLAGKSLMASNFSFGDRSNEAYSIKINSYLPHTATRLTASYQKIGANFQSFSLFNTSSRQSLWSARIDQPFFKRRLTMTASVRTNDFSNPYIDNNYYSNTVFKSILATLRMKKLPVISVGYFPSSQLTKVGDGRYLENLFYTLTGYISHFYTIHGTRMNTFLSYTRFYNRQADSGFVYFNTKNIMLTHSLFFSHFSLSGSGTAAVNNEYSLYTTGAELQMQIRKWFLLKGGLKYNYQTEFNNRQVGYNLGSTLKIPKLGELQMYVEKGFIPGVNKQLLPNNTGRFSYYKVF